MINATVVADSITPNGDRLTTLEVVMPRFILPEFNTHRAFSRNSASSRAIPFQRLVQQVWEHPYIPQKIGGYNAGMQPQTYLEGHDYETAVRLWEQAAQDAVDAAISLAYPHQYQRSKVWTNLTLGYDTEKWPIPAVAKELLNRILEPFLMTKVVVSATEWDNFFTLRDHEDAQTDIQQVAHAMRAALAGSTPRQLKWGHWHTPYIDTSDGEVSKDRLMLSASACAKVSYMREGTPMDLERAYDLAEAGHLSPFEHVATASRGKFANYTGFIQLRHLLDKPSTMW